MNLVQRVLIVCMLVWLAGCSTPQSRATSRQAAFEKLPKAFQERVLRSEIEVGMNEDALYIALGEPAQVEEGTFEDAPVNVWTYMRLTHSNVPVYRYGSGTDSAGLPTVIEYQDIARNHELKTSLKVFMRDGLVVGFEEIN